MEVLGINIESSAIGGAVVDTEGGAIISERKRTSPLEDSTPHKVLARMHDLVNNDFEWSGPVGCAFPAPVNNGIVMAAHNIDASWIDADAEQLFSEITDTPFSVINGTDAAALAEMQFGAGQDQEALTIVLTVGPGMGSSLFMDGQIVPNTELGLLEIEGRTAQERVSNESPEGKKVRKKAWAQRLQPVLEHFEEIFHPNLFILGGQLGQKASTVFPYIKINTAFEPANFQREARIIGAAMVGSAQMKE